MSGDWSVGSDRPLTVTIDGTDWLYGQRAVRRHVVNLVKLVGTFGEGVEYRIFLNRFRKSPYPEKPPIRPNVKLRTLPCPRRLFDRLNGWNLLPVNFIAGSTDIYHAAGANLFRCRARQYLYTMGGLAVFARSDLMPPGYVRQKQALLRSAFTRITHFLAVSETTRNELITLLDIPPERITAIPLGVDEEFKPLDPEESEAELKKEFPLRRPYALYVGGVQSNKNIAGLLKAFSLASRGVLASHQLVLAGPLDPDDRGTTEALARSGLGDRLLLTGTQQGETLVRLYSSADLFVFPSFYEGWTSPPLEAMACGVPVVASRASSIPETVGDAALLVDPGDPEDIARGMVRIVEDEELRSRLRERGFSRAAQFTWKRSICATVELYRKLGSG